MASVEVLDIIFPCSPTSIKYKFLGIIRFLSCRKLNTDAALIFCLASLLVSLSNSRIFQGGGSGEKKRIEKRALRGPRCFSRAKWIAKARTRAAVSPLDLPRQYQTSWQISNIIITAAAAATLLLLLDIRLCSACCILHTLASEKRVCMWMSSRLQPSLLLSGWGGE
jgi:hypothetical protein